MNGNISKIIKSENSEESNKSDVTTETVIKEDIAPRETRRQARKDLAYVEPLEEPGTIYNAEVHSAAQRLLKVHRITKYVKFCRCCSLPQETPGVVVPFNWFDKQLEFGMGIYLYFYYIKFCFVMAIICIGLSSISTIVFSKGYVSDIKDYCKKYTYNLTNQTNQTDQTDSTLRLLYELNDLKKECSKYLNYEDDDVDDDSFKADWLSDMSSYNIKSYYDVFEYNATESKKNIIHDVILDYSFMYFLTGIAVLISNYLFIQIVSLLSQYENFKHTTPADYAALVHGVPKPEDNGKMKDPLLKLVEQISAQINKPLVVDQVIPCLRIGDIYELAEKKYKEETKIYHVNNFEKQIRLNKEHNFSKENNNLHYFKSLLCVDTKTPVTEIENKIENYKTKLTKMQADLNSNPNNYNGGTFFVLFDNMLMKDQFCEFFPASIFSKILWSIRYFFENFLCCKCISEETRNRTKLKLSLNVATNIEPYEVEWENMGYTRCGRNFRLLFSIIAFLVLVVVELGIIIGLNALQRLITEKQKDFWKYVISLLISIIIAVTNYIGKLLFKKLTFIEKIEIKTHFYISYSIKLTIFTFVTIAILPVISNLIFGGDGTDILVNNLFMIFITNIFLPPLLFYFGPDLAIKFYKRTKARLELKNTKFEKSTYTQGELNEIFENPELDICFKYSYITNVFLISLFYMSIFPIGMIFGFVALILAYFSEFCYMGLYKRPEILNASLCRFYVSNFRWVIFIFALGNYIFLGKINKKQRENWSLINLIVFFVICIIPYQSLKINPYGESEGEHKYDTYKANFIYFSTDYEKLNPFTRIKGFTKYLNKIIGDGIIDPVEGKRLLYNLHNTNEMNSYLRVKRHLEYYIASQELNNLYMQNKNDSKIQYIFGKKKENEEGFSLGGIKNLLMESSELKEERMTSKDLDAIRHMKDCLYSFSTTNTGICNALIFLGEKNNINDEFENYHFNPWKAEWIYTPEYKRKRKNMIRQIRASMDYRGEISDDEDSIVKFDDKRDFITEEMKKLNDELNMKKRSSMRIREGEKDMTDKPMINNAELTTGEVNTKLRGSIYSSGKSPRKNSASDSIEKLNIKESMNKNDLEKERNNNSISGNILIPDPNLFPQDADENNQTK
jgi:hypothetical protein